MDEFYRLFDHYAHLGGAMFGVLYYRYGIRWWEDLRFLDLEEDPEQYQDSQEEKTP